MARKSLMEQCLDVTEELRALEQRAADERDVVAGPEFQWQTGRHGRCAGRMRGRLLIEAVFGELRVPRLRRLSHWRIAGIAGVFGCRGFGRSRFALLGLLLGVNDADSQRQSQNNEQLSQVHGRAATDEHGLTRIDPIVSSEWEA